MALYLCVALLMYLCLVCCVLDRVCELFGEKFAMCLGVVAVLLLNVMDVFSVGGGGGGGALLDRQCMAFHKMYVLCL